MDKVKLEESASELMQLVTQTTKQGIDFASEQAPLLFQEILVFGRVYYTCALLSGVLLGIVSLGCMAYILRQKEEGEIKCLKMILPVILGATPALIIVCANFAGFIEVWFAPRLYILDQIKGLL